eukprot:4432040-Pleurochrysis_carterae.AAC.1
MRTHADVCAQGASWASYPYPKSVSPLNNQRLLPCSAIGIARCAVGLRLDEIASVSAQFTNQTRKNLSKKLKSLMSVRLQTINALFLWRVGYAPRAQKFSTDLLVDGIQFWIWESAEPKLKIYTAQPRQGPDSKL